jgi:hypothetical protein
MKVGPNIGSKTFGVTEQIIKKAIAALATPVPGLGISNRRKLFMKKRLKQPRTNSRLIGLFNNGIMYPGIKT